MRKKHKEKGKKARIAAKPYHKSAGGSDKATSGRPETAALSSPERINRYLAHCGLCSRREADRWIIAGRISINGKLIETPGVIVQVGDHVMVDEKLVEVQQAHTYIIYHKPKGQLCSRSDNKGRPLIYDFLEVAPNVQSIGRLDMDTEGLLMLTDDGALTRALTHPGAKVPREYRARVAGSVSMETLEKLGRGGQDIGRGDISDAWEVTVSSESNGHTWLNIVILRGRWREVRRTLEESGHPVRRLLRTRFGPIKLDEDMPKGTWRALNRGEIRKLRDRVEVPDEKNNRD
ncbi:MAG: pseudouridine synthase [Mariprofundus sp.]|nr:pseudouridine synthase [Mariprofundus sp.]